MIGASRSSAIAALGDPTTALIERDSWPRQLPPETALSGDLFDARQD